MTTTTKPNAATAAAIISRYAELAANNATPDWDTAAEIVAQPQEARWELMETAAAVLDTPADWPTEEFDTWWDVLEPLWDGYIATLRLELKARA